MEETTHALSHLERLGPRRIVPGHGAVCDMGYVARQREYLVALQETVQELIFEGKKKAEVLDSERLPMWWTEDRRELQRANVARVHDELTDSSLNRR